MLRPASSADVDAKLGPGDAGDDAVVHQAFAALEIPGPGSRPVHWSPSAPRSTSVCCAPRPTYRTWSRAGGPAEAFAEDALQTPSTCPPHVLIDNLEIWPEERP